MFKNFFIFPQKFSQKTSSKYPQIIQQQNKIKIALIHYH